MLKKKILVVDDDARNIFALTATLKAKSYDCVSRQGAMEALALLETEENIDAILIDMMMPEMDGYEAIPKIKDINKRKTTPIFAVTAQAMVGDREKCLEAGADFYISKPIDVDQLLALLSKI